MKKVFKTEKANIIVRKLSDGRKRITNEKDILYVLEIFLYFDWNRIFTELNSRDS